MALGRFVRRDSHRACLVGELRGAHSKRRVLRMPRRPRGFFVASAAVLALLLAAYARADDAPVATITVTSATAGSSLGGKLVEGVMRFRDRQYLLTLHGVATSVTTRGSVFGLKRAGDIEGVFEPAGDALRNKSGVTVRFDPPLALEAGRLQIEATSGMQPKVSRGHRGSGVEK
jgi:hypothetical protein